MQRQQRDHYRKSSSGNTITRTTVLAGARGKLLDRCEYFVVRGARADDGDEAVDRVLVASLEELKQPGGVGAVVGESVFGCLVATVPVVQNCQVRLFVKGWTLVVAVALPPRSDQCDERALDWRGNQSTYAL